MRFESRSAIAAILALTSTIAAQDPSYTTIGAGCPGSAGTPTLSAIGGLPRVAETFTSQLTNVGDIGFAIGITGLSNASWGVVPLPADLTLVGMPGCLLFTDVRRQQALSINQGSADWELELPVGPEWQGTTFYQQAFVLDDSVPGLGGVMSDAAEGVIGLSLTEAPQVAVAFPPPCSTTENDYVVVRGTATDSDGIQAVMVNGVLALTSDGFANWQATIPLAGGPNPVVVSATDLLGYRSEETEFALTTSKPSLGQMWSIDVDPGSNRLVTGGSDLVAVDLDTGYRTRLASVPGNWTGLAVSGDTAVINSSWRVTRVDLLTGNMEQIANTVQTDETFSEVATDGTKAFLVSSDVGGSPADVWEVGLDGSGLRRLKNGGFPGPGAPEFRDLKDIAVRGSQAFITKNLQACSMPYVTGELLEFDLNTGSWRLVSGGFMTEQQTGSGPSLSEPIGVAMEGNRALTIDTCLDALVTIDLATGDRVVLADDQIGTGASLNGVSKVAAHDGRAFVPDPALKGLIQIDLATGNRTTFSPSGAGEGVSLSSPGSMIRVSDHFYVHDIGLDAVLMIDCMSGARSIVSGLGIGTGPTFSGDGDIEWSGSEILLADRASNSIIAIDPVTGDRTHISGAGLGAGPNFSSVGDIAVYGSTLLVRDGGLDALVHVDLTTGNRSVLPGGSSGFGTEIFGLDGLVVFGDEALVSTYESLVGVDLGTGDRRVVSSNRYSWGTTYMFPIDLQVDGQRAFVLDANVGIVSVEIATGNKTTASAQSGNGFHLANRVATMTSATDGSVFAVDLLSGEEVVVTK